MLTGLACDFVRDALGNMEGDDRKPQVVLVVINQSIFIVAVSTQRISLILLHPKKEKQSYSF
jgi:hypothetical protein